MYVFIISIVSLTLKVDPPPRGPEKRKKRKYSRTSMARTLMARLPRLFRTRS